MARGALCMILIDMLSLEGWNECFGNKLFAALPAGSQADRVLVQLLNTLVLSGGTELGPAVVHREYCMFGRYL